MGYNWLKIDDYFASALILYALTVVEPPDVDAAVIDTVFSKSSLYDAANSNWFVPFVLTHGPEAIPTSPEPAAT